MKSKQHRRLGIESLETRNLMAGNVQVSVDEGVLVITGDAAANRFEIQQLPGTSSTGGWQGARFKLSQPFVPGNQEPTTFNGQESVIVEGIKGGMEMNLRGGNDFVYVFGINGAGSRAQVPGVVTIDMGVDGDFLGANIENHNRVDIHLGTGGDGLRLAAGVHTLNVLGDPIFNPNDPPSPSSADLLDFWLTAGGAVSIDSKYGNDEILLRRPKTTGANATLTINSGGGIDRVVVDLPTAMLSASLRIESGDGNDRVLVQKASVTGNIIVNSGRGDDVVTIGITSVSNRLSVWAGEGDDIVQITQDVIADSSVFGGGDGIDTLEIGKDLGNELGDRQTSGFEVQRDL